MMKVIRATGARVVVLSLPLLFGAAAGAHAQAPSNPGANSIGVHGHWTIEVRESDGTRVTRHEFDNLLSGAGLPILQTLARVATPGQWAVIVTDIYSVGSPCTSQVQCVLHEPGDTAVFQNSTRFLVLNVSLEGSPVPNKLVLQGTFTVPAAGQISRVMSILEQCDNTVAPGDPPCAGTPMVVTSHDMRFSAAPPVGPIPVAAGQIVQVRVELTFSAAPTT